MIEWNTGTERAMPRVAASASFPFIAQTFADGGYAGPDWRPPR